MNAEQLHDALNFLPDDLITAADRLRTKKTRKSALWLRLLPLAACFAVVVAALYMVLPTLAMKSTSAESQWAPQDNYSPQVEMAGAAPEPQAAADTTAEAAPREDAAEEESETEGAASAMGTLLTEPPKLVLRAGEQKATVGYSSATWDCEGQSFIACGVSPGSKWGGDPTLTTTEETVELIWAVMPDSVTVRCWSNARSTDTWDVAFEAELTGSTLTLDPDYQIYEITATWNSSESYSGTASYAVYILTEE